MRVGALLWDHRRKLFWLGAALFVLWYGTRPPLIAGDVWDYLYPLEAWSNHGSPDIRPEDQAGVNDLFEAHNLGHLCQNSLDNLPFYIGVVRAPDGHYFAWHFWLYSLLAVPAKYFLWLLGGNELAALQTTNAAFFVCAIYLVLFERRARLSSRLLLLGFSAVSPVIWYLRWPSPEAFTWSAVIASLAFLSGRRYVLASFCSALGAMQNPPVVFLTAYIVLYSMHERRAKLTGLSAAVGLWAFLPNLFYSFYYGTPNLIAGSGATDRTLISWSRTWSFLTDLNQGMLPYVPGLLLLTSFSVFCILLRRRLAGMGMILVLASMILACEVTTNWNSGATGMMRYAVWIVPLFAWLTAQFLAPRRSLLRVAGIAVALQAVVVVTHTSEQDGHRQSRFARLVLTHAPYLYNPEPEIFFERQLHCDHPITPVWLPLPFIHGRQVTKVLTDRQSLEKLGEEFIVDPAYLARIKHEYRDRNGLFYLTPPTCAIMTPPRPDPSTFQDSVHLELLEVAKRVNVPAVPLKLALSNTGSTTFWGEGSITLNPLRVCYSVAKKGGSVLYKKEWELPGNLGPGACQTLSVALPLPVQKGEYTIEVQPVLECIAFSLHSSRLTATISNGSSSAFAARIVPEKP